MGRQARTAVLFVALAMLAAACLRGSSPEAKTRNQIVWALAGDTEIHQQTAEMWNKEHPDHPVRIEKLPDDADGQRTQLGLELNAESSGFDVMALDVIYTGEFASYGWIENLEDLRGEVEDKLLEAPLQSATYNGKLWALPYNSNAGFLYYRTDLLDEPPKTWDEARKMYEQVSESEDIGGLVGQGAPYEGLVVNFLEYYWGAGGDIFGDNEQDITFARGDAAKTALEFMRTAQEEQFFAPGFNTMLEDQAKIAFQEGDALFMRNWPSFFGVLMEEAKESKIGENFGIAPLPTFKDGEQPTGLGGFNLAVSAYSEKKDLAKEFALFAATNEKVQLNLGKNALPPTVASVYDELQDDPVMKLLGEILPEAHTRPPVPAYNDISVVLQRHVFPAYTGELQPDVAIETISAELEELIRRRETQ